MKKDGYAYFLPYAHFVQLCSCYERYIMSVTVQAYFRRIWAKHEAACPQYTQLGSFSVEIRQKYACTVTKTRRGRPH